MKVYIGDIVSVNSSEEVFRYLVEDAGRICYVGDVLPEKYASAERVDLDGRALLLCAFIGWRQELDSYLERILGEERTAALNPIGTFERNGISVSFGSDAPCTSPDPILWIHKAVNHSNPPERVPVRSAVRMATWKEPMQPSRRRRGEVLKRERLRIWSSCPRIHTTSLSNP